MWSEKMSPHQATLRLPVGMMGPFWYRWEMTPYQRGRTMAYRELRDEWLLMVLWIARRDEGTYCELRSAGSRRHTATGRSFSRVASAATVRLSEQGVRVQRIGRSPVLNDGLQSD